jgi:hypothetical protein
MIAQAILDAQARLTTAVAALSTKVDTLIANQADPNAATLAEQATIATAINDTAAAVEAIAAK